MRKNTNTKNTNKVKVEKVKVEGGFELTNDIPIPEDTGRKGVKSAFRKTVENMKVGQSFVTDSVPKHRYNMEKKIGLKLTVRKEGDKFRVWRKN